MANTSYLGVGPADRDPTVSDDSVTTAKIQNASVTALKLATTGTASSSTFLRGDMSWQANAGGDVVGPASSTDDALARFDSTTGKLIQNSTATLSDAGTLTATAFSGPLTGNVTGNASGTAATVTGGTQASITTAANLVTVGTIGTGVWQGTAIADAYIGNTINATHIADGSVTNTEFQYINSLTSNAQTQINAKGDASLASDQTWTGSQRGTLVTDNDGSFDQNGGNNFFCTPSGNVTLTFTNHTSGQSGYILFDNAGGHTISLHANTKGDANLASTLSTAGTYLVSYLDNGTNAYLTTSAVFA